jgi:hypothetical protein
MIKIRLMISVFALLIFLTSCINRQNDSKKKNTETTEKKNTETTIKQNADSVIVNPVVKKKKSEDRYPKVLTYIDIIEKNEQFMMQYKELRTYITDTIDRKIQLNQSFHDYLTTQLKYMLSSELRLLRNEFYARKGYKFKSTDLNDYFSEYDWYSAKIDDASNIKLSPFEIDVIDTIKVYEERNKDLDAESLKKTFLEYCKNNIRKASGGNFIEIPSILFRRNLGYQIEGLPDHNRVWFSGESLSIQIVDTLKNDNLLLGLFGCKMCPAEYCLFAGELVSCDSSLNYLDSKPVEFETIEISQNAGDRHYRFEATNSPISPPLTIVRVDNNGKIRIE